ncbi:MAG: rRNA adenine N-6-methyltransferase family protein [Candidatus Omnitrophica bacterium]|nr:rRNA adenine N-6-methyltransferase family protein [Candidatus Omnitrophota bacterium]
MGISARPKIQSFSNIPFFHTTEIVNKLLFGAEKPEDCYLVTQKDAAEKFCGFQGDNLASVLIKPLFWVDIIHYFKRTDFRPAPSVDVVLLQLEKRKCPLVSKNDYGLYKDFIVFTREGASRMIKTSFKELLTYPQIKQLSKLLKIDYHSYPSVLNFQQYLGLFQFFKEHNSRKKEMVIGAETRLRRQEAQMVKTYRTKRGQQ